MDGDEELPDIRTLVGKFGRSAAKPAEARDGGGEQHRRKRRRVVEDSDDDSDE